MTDGHGQKTNGLFGRCAVGINGSYLKKNPRNDHLGKSGGLCLNITMNLVCLSRDVHNALCQPEEFSIGARPA